MSARDPRSVRVAESVIHLLYHLDGQQVLTEATLGQVLGRLATWASDVTGEPVRYNPTRALQTLSLVVAS
jgi:hypothetical protein